MSAKLLDGPDQKQELLLKTIIDLVVLDSSILATGRRIRLGSGLVCDMPRDRLLLGWAISPMASVGAVNLMYGYTPKSNLGQ